MTSYKVEVLPSPVSDVGTRAHWDIDRQSVYSVDIYGANCTLLRYDYAEDKTYEATIGKCICIIFIKQLFSHIEFSFN